MPVPPLHVVTDDLTLARNDFRAAAAAVLEAGGPQLALHLRGPRTCGGDVFRLARDLLPVARSAGAILLVNDRADVSACVGADGVQLGRRSLPVAEARRLLGAGFLIGSSVHGAREAAQADGSDFLLVGTLFETPSHPGMGCTGTGILPAVAAVAPGVPLVGIGGVTPERIPELRAAGALGFAVIRGIWGAASPPGAVERYLSQWLDPE